MGERGGADEIGMMGDENEDGEMSCERVFTVGEVVEFWEGAFCEEGGRQWVVCNKNGGIM